MGHYTIRTGNETGKKIDLDDLDEISKRFLGEAWEKLKTNEDWVEFEKWAFGVNSPLYHTSYIRDYITSDPLYKILKDMATRLGIQQNEIDGEIT